MRRRSGEAAQAVFLLTLDPPLAQPAISTALPALPRLLSGTPVEYPQVIGLADLARLLADGSVMTDPRGAVVGLAALSRWNLTWADEQYLEAHLNDGVSAATISFDQQGRITNITGRLTGQA